MVSIPDPKKTVFRALSYIYTAVMVFFLLKPGLRETPATGVLPSFTLHLTAFTVLFLLYYEGFRKDSRKGRYSVIIKLYLLAPVVEILQIIVPGRNFSFLDMGMNIIGLVLGGLLVWFRNRLTEHQ